MQTAMFSFEKIKVLSELLENIWGGMDDTLET